MGSNLGLENLEQMLAEISRDHSRLDAELSNVKAEIKLKDNDLLAINKEIEISKKESDKILKRFHEEKTLADELYNKEVKLREEIFGTETDFKSSKLYKISGLKSDLEQAKMKKDHSLQRIQNIEADIEMYRILGENSEKESPIVRTLQEAKHEVAELQRKLSEMYMNGRIDDIQTEVNHLKETIGIKNMENDRNQEESVNKKKEKKQLEDRKQQLATEIRCLENRTAAKKKRLTNTIEELTAQLLIISTESMN